MEKLKSVVLNFWFRRRKIVQNIQKFMLDYVVFEQKIL